MDMSTAVRKYAEVLDLPEGDDEKNLRIKRLKRTPLSFWLQGESSTSNNNSFEAIPLPPTTVDFEFPSEEALLLRIMSYLSPRDLCTGENSLFVNNLVFCIADIHHRHQPIVAQRSSTSS